jgi:23S rRNA U2552 (ribose-2'-O)-methylase RlmE/FtsJ
VARNATTSTSASTSTSTSTCTKDKAAIQQEIADLFSKFGKVEEVFLPDRSTKQYAFVNMETSEAAQRALAELGPSSSKPKTPVHALFGAIRAAHTVLPRNRNKEKAHKRRKLADDQRQATIALAQSSNFVLQLHRSHVERLVDFLKETKMPHMHSSSTSTCSSTQDQDGQLQVQVMGSIPTTSKTVSLVFVQASTTATYTNTNTPTQSFTALLDTMWFVQPIVHRVFCLTTTNNNDNKKEPMIVQGQLETDVVRAIVSLVSSTLLLPSQTSSSSLSATNSSIRIRLAVFPPKLGKKLLQAIDDQWDTTTARSTGSTTTSSLPGLFDQWKKHGLSLSPTNPTHSVGIVQLVADTSTGNNNTNTVHGAGGGVYGLGIQAIAHAQIRPTPSNKQLFSSSNQPGNGGTANNDDKDDEKDNEDEDDICRAYWKLQEAWERYKYELPQAGGTSISSSGMRMLTALDCGAAPGGWTQYLAQHVHCSKIYSIDPGELSPVVLALPQVEHLTMTIQKALPYLQEKNNSSTTSTTGAKNSMIDIYVSDMCVKDMEQQVDHLLQAATLGVVTSGCFFVLTLKCISGHSKKTFDLLVAKQVQRLLPHVDPLKLQTVHLFNNRMSERTVLGYWK